MRFCNYDQDVIYDALAKANRHASKTTWIESSNRDVIIELRHMTEDLLNSLENINFIDEEEDY